MKYIVNIKKQINSTNNPYKNWNYETILSKEFDNESEAVIEFMSKSEIMHEVAKGDESCIIVELLETGKGLTKPLQKRMAKFNYKANLTKHDVKRVVIK